MSLCVWKAHRNMVSVLSALAKDDITPQAIRERERERERYNAMGNQREYLLIWRVYNKEKVES